jgi:hypothetical protein
MKDVVRYFFEVDCISFWFPSSFFLTFEEEMEELKTLLRDYPTKHDDCVKYGMQCL